MSVFVLSLDFLLYLESVRSFTTERIGPSTFLILIYTVLMVLTMYDSELSLIRLLQTGVKGFLKKDIHPSELKFAITSVVQSGYYYSSHTTGKLANLFRNNKEGNMNLQSVLLSDQEVSFLKLACSDFTYKEIAEKMELNPRSIDTLRDHLFVKLDVKSRVGLAMVAIKNGIVTF